MTEDWSPLAARAAQLRSAFDRSFAAPAQPEAAPLQDLLAIGVAGDAYALRLTDLTSLVADVRVAPVPSRIRDLLGIAWLRGRLVAVYDLRGFLGHSAGEVPRWLAVARGDDAVGLAFERFEGHLRVRQDEILPAESGRQGPYTRELVQSAAGVRPIVHLPSLFEEITKRVRSGAPEEDRNR